MSANRPSGFGLRRQCLSFLEVLGQSIAGISPTSTSVLVVALVFASAGNGTWLAYLLATIGLLLVGLQINQFGKRSASPGAFFVYVGQALGPSVGFISGWALLLAYILSSAAALCAAVNFTSVLLTTLHVSVPALVWYTIAAVLIWYAAYRDIRLSANLMLLLESVSIALVLILGVFVLIKRSTVIDWPQFQLNGINYDGVRLGLVLAVFSYSGFESATALGEEAKRPLVHIPRAILLSPVISGILFIFFSYVEILGFRGLPAPLDQSSAPINDLANSIGLSSLGVVITFGGTISLLACALGSVNAASRIMLRMGRHGVLHNQLGVAHQQNETPHHATTISAILMFLISVIPTLRGIPALDVTSATGTIATFGFLLAYILVSIAAPVYLRSLGELRPRHILMAIASLLFLLIPTVATFYPLPAPPADKFPLLFAVYMLAGITWFAWLRLTSSGLAERIREDIQFECSVPARRDGEIDRSPN
jgi:amino acid transporter